MEQSTSAPSFESPTAAATDPMGTTNKLEKTMDQLNANIDRISTFLEQLCQRIPTGECSREAREIIHMAQRAQAAQTMHANGNAAKVYPRKKDATALHEIPQGL